MAKGNTNQKLKKLKLTDGKAAPDSRVFANIRTIDEILGTTPMSPFKSKSIAEFEKKIDEEMNLADMQALASRVGLLPIHDRTLLKKRLIDAFKQDYRKKTPYGEIDAVEPNANLKESMSGKALSVLKEGV